MWKSRGGIIVNGVPREVPRPKLEGPQALSQISCLVQSLPWGFWPRFSHIFSFFCHPGSVKRDFLHCRQTQPAPRGYHTKYYLVEVQTLVELNPNILVRDVERIKNMPYFCLFKSKLSCLHLCYINIYIDIYCSFIYIVIIIRNNIHSNVQFPCSNCLGEGGFQRFWMTQVLN